MSMIGETLLAEGVVVCVWQACSFLLSNPEVLNYNSFYEGCITLLSAGAKGDKAKGDAFNLLVSICSPLVVAGCPDSYLIAFDLKQADI